MRRDRRRIRRKVHTNPHIHRLLRFLARRVLLAVFAVETTGAQLISRAPGPFIILGNHSAVIDPMIVGISVSKPIQYVVSDSQFRSRILSWVLGLVGSIPKTKVMSDLDTVKKIVAVKSAAGVIGIFPEGQSCWDGHNLPITRATDKLIKSLKIPVYTARIEGAYLSWPRWARRPRRGRIRIAFEQLFTAEELKVLPVDTIRTMVEKALAVDAFEFQRSARFVYRGARQAEYLERVLFVCPACHGLGTLVSNHRRVNCHSCGYSVVFTNHGFFVPRRGPLHFETIREWNLWQMDWFERYLEEMKNLRNRSGTGVDTPLLTETAVKVSEGFKTQPLRALGDARLTLFPDRLMITLASGSNIDIPLDTLEGINVQNNEHLEFYASMTLYRISTATPRGNTLKWDYAIRFLRGKTILNVAPA